MELQKGLCSLCHNVRIIASSEAKKAYEIICTLFSKKILNIPECGNISLKFCPVCYHELIILNRLKKNIDEKTSRKSETKCFLCKHGESLFKITSWNYFDEIFQDLGFKYDYYITCSECLFYLHARNELKAKLISRSPQLDTRRALDHSTIQTDEEDHNTATGKFTKFFNISKEEKILRKSVNFNSIRKLKPLKYNKNLKALKIVQTDPKLFNQIPFVLLKVVNLDDSEDIDKKTMLIQAPLIKSGVSTSKSGLVCISEPKQNKAIHQLMNSKSILMKTDLNSQRIIKKLVVRLSRMSEKYQLHTRMFENNENRSNMERLNDKFNLIQKKTTTHKVNIEQECSLKRPYICEEKEACSKKKTKNVSFCEDRNIEIQYFENDIKKNNSHDNSLGNLSTKSYFPQKKESNTSISQTNPRTKQEHFVAETTKESFNHNFKPPVLGISDKDLHKVVEKIDSKDDIDQEERKVDEEIIFGTNSTSEGYKSKPISKELTKITDDLDNRSETVVVYNIDKIPESNSKNTAYNTVQKKKGNMCLDNNDGSITSSNTFKSSLTEHLLNEDLESNTHKENAILNLENNKSSPTQKPTEMKVSIDINVNDKKEYKLDSENMLSIHESKIVTDMCESKFNNIDLNNGKQYSSDANIKSENGKVSNSENQSCSVINDELKHVHQSRSQESEVNKIHKEKCKSAETVDLSYFSDSEKNDVEITENDKNNINSILSGFTFHQEQLEDNVSNNTTEESHANGNEKIINESDINCGTKRDLNDEEVKITDKKKRVTFCKTII